MHITSHREAERQKQSLEKLATAQFYRVQLLRSMGLAMSDHQCMCFARWIYAWLGLSPGRVVMQ
eukprot:7831594-Karenia_brevis.AAC.1